MNNEQKKFHLANRITLGVTEKTLQDIEKLGIKKYIRSQLKPKSANYVIKPQRYNYLDLTVKEIFSEYFQPYIVERQKKPLSPEQKKTLSRQRHKFTRGAIGFKIINSINNPNQLQDLMTNFWFNHFNVFINKQLIMQRFLIHHYEQKTIRPLALGNFKNLLTATVFHPSMLYYLDNWKNDKPNSGRRGQRGLNENYARELMELHTMGVDGGYTQADVISLAKILTGLTVFKAKTPPKSRQKEGYVFDRRFHDFSDKVFLGQKIKGEGIAEIYKAIDILVSHPSTAKFISFKLAQHFVADQPPNSLVNKMAKTFRRSKGEIPEVLNTLFSSQEFWDDKYYQKKFKTPYEYVISTLRLANISKPKIKGVSNVLNSLDMLPYHRLTPDGYSNVKSAWLSSNSMINRVDFATDVSQGQLSSQTMINPYELTNLLKNYLSGNTLKVVSKSGNDERLAIILGSPDMMFK